MATTDPAADPAAAPVTKNFLGDTIDILAFDNEDTGAQLKVPDDVDDQTDASAGAGAGPSVLANKNNLPGIFLFLKVEPKGKQDAGKKGAFLALAYDPDLTNVNHLSNQNSLDDIKKRYKDNPPYLEDLTKRTDTDTTSAFNKDAVIGPFGTTQSGAGSCGWYGGYDKDFIAKEVILMCAIFHNTTYQSCKSRNSHEVVGTLVTSDPKMVEIQDVKTKLIKRAPQGAVIKPGEGTQHWYEYTVEFYSLP